MKMMIEFASSKIFRKLVGEQTNSRYSIILRILFSLLPFTVLVASTVDFVAKIPDDANRAWASLPTIFTYLMVTSNYWHVIVNRRQFDSLFMDIRDVVNESK